jgi:hypothetical protein
VILDALARVAEPMRLAFLWRPLLSGAQEETAINGSADTHNIEYS